MKLGNIATRFVICLKPRDSFDRAITLMEEHGFHHLPVIQDGRVVGMISDRDLLLAVGWQLEAQRRLSGSRRDFAGPRNVSEVMSKPVVCLSPNDDLHTAARVMIDHSISAIPLTTGDALMGIVTKIGLLKALCETDPPIVRVDRLAEPVAGHMRHHVHTVGPQDPLHTASRIMHEKHVRHLPVTTEGLLIGMVSDRDVRQACGREIIEDELAEAHGRLYATSARVLDVMSHRIETTTASTALMEAANKMLDAQIGALPVVSGERLVGIITHTDVLRIISESAA